MERQSAEPVMQNRKVGKRGGVSKNVLLKNLLLILSWKEFELVGSIYGEYHCFSQIFSFEFNCVNSFHV